MMSNKAWQRHGCYRLGSAQYFNMPLESALTGCDDDWNSLDHFDPTTDMRLLMKHFMYLRTTYNALQDGWDLVQRGNWTYFVDFPGSNNTATEMGLWSVSRAGIPTVQNLTGQHIDQVWLLYMNENTSKTYSYDCSGALWISSPYISGTTVKNLLSPYENYTLAPSGSSYYGNNSQPWYGCLESVDMNTYGMKALVPINEWVAPPPMLTRFLPGHDARIEVTRGQSNATIVDIVLEFNTAMSCENVTQSLSFNMSSSGIGGQPVLNLSSVVCNTVTNPVMSPVVGTPYSQWSWSGTLTNVTDGILEIIVNNPSSYDGTITTGVCLFSVLRRVLLMVCRASIICCCGRAKQTISWCSLIPITIAQISSTLTASIRSRTVPTGRICSGTRATTH
jgi:alpha-1,3-glucan synthase